MQRSWMLALVLLGAALAGCVGGEDDSAAEGPLQSKATATADTGGIEGVITDPAIQPVEGAEVRLQEIGRSTTTAADGSFAFSEVTPSTYTLRVEAEGYLSTDRQIQVEADDVLTVDVVLTNRPSVLPYAEQIEFQGFVECSLATPVVLVAVCAIPNSLLSFAGGGNATNDRFLFTFPIQEDPWQMVTEVRWDAGQPLGQSLSMSVEPNGLPNDNKTEFGGLRGESPLIHRTDRARIAEVDHNTTKVCSEELDPESDFSASREAYCNRAYIDEGGSVMVRLFVSNTDLTGQGIPTGGVAAQQSYELVVTTFYHAPACETYSLFDGNTCDQADTSPAEDPATQVGDDA